NLRRRGAWTFGTGAEWRRRMPETHGRLGGRTFALRRFNGRMRGADRTSLKFQGGVQAAGTGVCDVASMRGEGGDPRLSSDCSFGPRLGGEFGHIGRPGIPQRSTPAL